jgi:predicted dehydrogenase
VLCEKPFTANADEAAVGGRGGGSHRPGGEEAFHYRYHPPARRMHQIAASGELGELWHIEAQLCVPLVVFSNIRSDFGLAGGGADGRRLLHGAPGAAARR